MLDNSNLISFLATKDPKRARGFYADILGLTFISEDPFALVFEVSGVMLRIQKVERLEPAQHTALGWSVSNIQEQVIDLLKRGVKFSRFEGMDQDQHGIWTSPGGARIAWFKDPDGNVLSLTQFP